MLEPHRLPSQTALSHRGSARTPKTGSRARRANTASPNSKASPRALRPYNLSNPVRPSLPTKYF
eukprot:7036424-Lingulodinium_polyedra.AAC.1